MGGKAEPRTRGRISVRSRLWFLMLDEDLTQLRGDSLLTVQPERRPRTAVITQVPSYIHLEGCKGHPRQKTSFSDHATHIHTTLLQRPLDEVA